MIRSTAHNHRSWRPGGQRGLGLAGAAVFGVAALVLRLSDEIDTRERMLDAALGAEDRRRLAS